MKYIRLKDVMKLVQKEREKFKKDIWFLKEPASKALALEHFRNILRQLTDWTEQAKDDVGPIASDTDHVYVLYSSMGAIFGISRSYEDAVAARQGVEEEYPDMEVLISRADLLD